MGPASSPNTAHNVTVAAVIRPLFAAEGGGPHAPLDPAQCATTLAVTHSKVGGGSQHLWLKGYERTYQFEHYVFPEDVTSRKQTPALTFHSTPIRSTATLQLMDLYDKVGRPALDQALAGQNVCVLAYGQTGSGKTYSMFGTQSPSGQEYGLVQNTLRDLFSRVGAERSSLSKDMKVEVSMFEVYNEKLYCLLSKSGGAQAPLKVRQDGDAVAIDGLKKVEAKDFAEAEKWIKTGEAARIVGDTKANRKSSRSHAIVQVYLSIGTPAKRSIKVTLVDLAGSERFDKAHPNSEKLQQEGIHINNALSALGRVVQSLGDTTGGHVSYRDSLLTWVLQDCINAKGSSRLSLLACLSPAPNMIDETVSTLRFADRIKDIRSVPSQVMKTELTNPFDKRSEPSQSVVPIAGGATEHSFNVGEEPMLVNLDPHLRPQDKLCWLIHKGVTSIGTFSKEEDENSYSRTDGRGKSERRHIIVLKGGVNVSHPHCHLTCSRKGSTEQVTLSPGVGGSITYIDGKLVTEPVVLRHASRVIIGNSHCFLFVNPQEAERLLVKQNRKGADDQGVPKVLDWGYACDEFARVMQVNKSYEDVIRLQDEIEYWRSLSESEAPSGAPTLTNCCLLLISTPKYFQSQQYCSKRPGLVFPLQEGVNKISAEVWGLSQLCDGGSFYLEVVRGQIFKCSSRAAEARTSGITPEGEGLQPVHHGMHIMFRGSEFLVNCPCSPVDCEEEEEGDILKEETEAPMKAPSPRRSGGMSPRNKKKDIPKRTGPTITVGNTAYMMFKAEHLEDLVHGLSGFQYQVLQLHDQLYPLPVRFYGPSEMDDSNEQDLSPAEDTSEEQSRSPTGKKKKGRKKGKKNDESASESTASPREREKGLAYYAECDPLVRDIIDFKYSLKDDTLLDNVDTAPPREGALNTNPHLVLDFLSDLTRKMRSVTHQFCERLDAPPPQPFDTRISGEDILRELYEVKAERQRLESENIRLQATLTDRSGSTLRLEELASRLKTEKEQIAEDQIETSGKWQGRLRRLEEDLKVKTEALHTMQTDLSNAKHRADEAESRAAHLRQELERVAGSANEEMLAFQRKTTEVSDLNTTLRRDVTSLEGKAEQQESALQEAEESLRESNEQARELHAALQGVQQQLAHRRYCEAALADDTAACVSRLPADIVKETLLSLVEPVTASASSSGSASFPPRDLDITSLLTALVNRSKSYTRPETPPAATAVPTFTTPTSTPIPAVQGKKEDPEGKDNSTEVVALQRRVARLTALLVENGVPLGRRASKDAALPPTRNGSPRKVREEGYDSRLISTPFGTGKSVGGQGVKPSEDADGPPSRSSRQSRVKQSTPTPVARTRSISNKASKTAVRSHSTASKGSEARGKSPGRRAPSASGQHLRAASPGGMGGDRDLSAALHRSGSVPTPDRHSHATPRPSRGAGAHDATPISRLPLSSRSKRSPRASVSRKRNPSVTREDMVSPRTALATRLLQVDRSRR